MANKLILVVLLVVLCVAAAQPGGSSGDVSKCVKEFLDTYAMYGISPTDEDFQLVFYGYVQACLGSKQGIE